ncbi:MAG: hypothetical protein JXB07_10400 [Anaerolineae bacterium]|nr:hypothetical protein [Anaerolineae bacterium]
MVSSRSTKILFVSLWTALVIALTVNISAMASETDVFSGDSDRMYDGEVYIGLQAGCGDGICDPYMGENATTCPADCAPPSTMTTTVTATPTWFRRATRTPTATLTSSATPTASPTPSETPTMTPTEPGIGVFGCDLVAYESRAQAWQKGYGGAVAPGAFVPQRTDNREIYVCEVPPVGRICIPIYQGLLKAVQEDIGNIVLVDCSLNGACRIHERQGYLDEESICFDVIQTDDLSCSAGCALAPRQTNQFVIPFLSTIPLRLLAPGACLISLLFFGAVLAIIFVTRRSRPRKTSAARAAQTVDRDISVGAAVSGNPSDRDSSSSDDSLSPWP